MHEMLIWISEKYLYIQVVLVINTKADFTVSIILFRGV